jgi:hypothetical protein
MESYEKRGLYARVSTNAQQKEGTIESQVLELKRQFDHIAERQTLHPPRNRS